MSGGDVRVVASPTPPLPRRTRNHCLIWNEIPLILLLLLVLRMALQVMGLLLAYCSILHSMKKPKRMPRQVVATIYFQNTDHAERRNNNKSTGKKQQPVDREEKDVQRRSTTTTKESLALKCNPQDPQD
jgi:hypothetical protein